MYCFANFCRLCLQRNENLHDFQTKDDDNITIINKIRVLMPSLIFSRDNFPTLICDKCLLQLNNSYNFMNNCFTTYQQLLKYSLQLNFNGDKTNHKLEVLLDKLNYSHYSGVDNTLRDAEEEDVIQIDDEIKDTLVISDEEAPVKKRKLDGQYVLKINSEEGFTVTINVDANAEEGLAEIRNDVEVEAENSGEAAENQNKAENHDNTARTTDDKAEKPGDKAEKPDDRAENLDDKAENLDDKAENPDDDENRIHIVNISNNLAETNDTPEIIKIAGPDTDAGNKMERKRYACGTCGKSYIHKPNVKRHYENVHLKIRYNCQVCGNVFRAVESLRYHERVVHLNLRNYICNYCEFPCAEPYHLKSHLKNCRARKKAEKLMNEAANFGDKAESSPSKAESSPNKAEKSPNKAENSPNKARNSSKTKNSSNKAEKSPNKAEKSPNKAEKSPNKAENSPNKAEKSPNKAENSSNKAENLSNKAENSPNKGKIWYNKAEVFYNQAENPFYKAENCINLGESPPSANTDDAEDRPLVIDEQGGSGVEEAAATTSSNVQEVVVKAYDDMYPHKCTICKKMFASKAGLKIHYNFRHFKERHKCPHCGQRFVRFDNFRAHVNAQHAHMKSGRFKCDTCNEQFSTKRMLEQHGQNHMTEKCTMCIKVFANVPLLRLHYKYEHNITEDRMDLLFKSNENTEVVENKEDGGEEGVEEDVEEEERPKIEEIVVEEFKIKKEEMNIDGDEYLLPD